jgi:hypothetical protein
MKSFLKLTLLAVGLTAIVSAQDTAQDSAQDILAAQKTRLKQRLADIQESGLEDPALYRALMEDAVRDMAADRSLLINKVTDEEMNARRREMRRRKLEKLPQGERLAAAELKPTI